MAKQDDKYDVLRNNNSKYLFNKFNDSLATIGELVKAVRHSKKTQDYVAIEAIQNQNWQYFVETLLYGCSEGENLISFDENYKKSKVITNAFQNITICKQTYNRFYEQISSNFEMTINNLPADEKQEINRDLQNLNYNITVGEKNLNQFIDTSALDISADFFQNEGRFPGTQDLIILPKPEIPNFLRKHDILSTNDLFKKIPSSVAHGLVSINALAALNMYRGGMSTVSKNAMSEFLHNMSYQALNIENDEIFIKFNGIAQLINDINETLIERNNQSIQISDVMNTNILNEINNYKFIFDVPTEMEIQDDVDK